MIFAHGHTILPGVLGLSVKPFGRILYVWLATLQFSLLFRIAGDIYLHSIIRKTSGLITGVAIAGYFISVAILMMRAQQRDEQIL